MTRIETFFISGPAGRIECMLKRSDSPGATGGAATEAGRSAATTGGPEAAVAEAAVAVICHPHPLFGGTMHNKVVHAAAEAISESGLPVLRFNFRGVGRSDGKHDGGRGEQDDLRTVMDHLSRTFPGKPLLVAGYSFGAYVALHVGSRDDRAVALIGIGLPLSLVGFGFLRESAKPLAIIQGDRDEFGPLPQIMALAAALPGGARVVVVKDAPHNFAGRLDVLARRVTEAIPEALRAGPL